jgi:hypothetical protein
MFRYFIFGFIIFFCLNLTLSGQTISGIVISEFYGPIPGAVVWVPQTNIGTVTDINGNYSIIWNGKKQPHFLI